MSKTKEEVARLALDIYANKDHWTYVQGGLGEIGESKRINSLYDYFWNRRDIAPNSMTRPYKAWVMDHATDMCTDCNNFINVVLDYDHNYYSVWSLSQLPTFQGELNDAPIATVLWMPGHVGLVVQPGKVMDFYKYECEPRITDISIGLWKSAHYLPEVNYEEVKVMRTWDEVIKQALFLYVNRANITYCLGCSGEVVGRDKRVENQFKYYYQTTEWQDKIGASINGWVKGISVDDAWLMWSTQYAGKMAFDCSGFIDFCIGYPGNHKYSSWNFGDMPKNKSVVDGVAGSALWKKGHVGLDFGYGYELEIGSYGGTIELHKISERDFMSSHLITDVNYEGADAR